MSVYISEYFEIFYCAREDCRAELRRRDRSTALVAPRLIENDQRRGIKAIHPRQIFSSVTRDLSTLAELLRTLLRMPLIDNNVVPGSRE